MTPLQQEDQGLTIAGKTYRSRLLVGSGKYKDLDETRAATVASGAEIITVAIRRVNIGQDPNAPSLLDAVPPSEYTILPNTAGCYNAADAVYTLQLARELLGGHKLVKLEVLGDEKTLFPTCRKPQGRRNAGQGWLRRWSIAATTPSRRACWKTSAWPRSCRWPR
jgi:thiazole synthase